MATSSIIPYVPPSVPAPVDVVESFLDSLSPLTRRAYDGDLRDYATHVGTADVHVAVRTLLENGHGAANLAALEYRTAMTSRGLAPTTIARRLAALRSVVRLARMIGRVSWTLDVRSPKTEPYRDTSGPGSDGWKAIVTNVRERSLGGEGRPPGKGRAGAKATRDHAIVRLLHDLGLRREEVVELDLGHVETAAVADHPRYRTLPTHVSILGKGRTERERLTLAPRTAEALMTWILVRGMWDPGPLFCPLDHALDPPITERLTGGSVARIVNGLGRDAGLSRSVTPHGLRHQAITAALDKTGGDVRRVQRFSRHKDVRTLLRYDDRRRDDPAEVSRLVSED
jgi:integrase/recombinase XerC